MRPRGTVALILALALIAAACGGGDSADDTTTTSRPSTVTTAAPTTTAAPAATTTTADGGATTTTSGGGAIELTIGAEDSEGFTRDRLTAPAGQEVTVIFVNKDDGGEPHNWHLKTNGDEWATPITGGPDTNAVSFVVANPGEYDYWCDTHSETMRGTFVAETP